MIEYYGISDIFWQIIRIGILVELCLLFAPEYLDENYWKTGVAVAAGGFSYWLLMILFDFVMY